MNSKVLSFSPLQIAFFALAFMFSSLLYSEESKNIFELGVDYELISKGATVDVAQLSELESISNMEVFYWYGCESCYQVEAATLEFLKQKPEVTFRRTPLVIRPEWRQQAYVQAIMEQQSELEKRPSTIEIYQQCLQDCSVFKQFESSQQWLFNRIGNDDLLNIDQERIWQTEKNYQKRADLFSITQVPTIIINENYQVNANQAKTSKRLVEIIDFLLTK